MIFSTPTLGFLSPLHLFSILCIGYRWHTLSKTFAMSENIPSIESLQKFRTNWLSRHRTKNTDQPKTPLTANSIRKSPTVNLPITAPWVMNNAILAIPNAQHALRPLFRILFVDYETRSSCVFFRRLSLPPVLIAKVRRCAEYRADLKPPKNRCFVYGQESLLAFW